MTLITPTPPRDQASMRESIHPTIDDASSFRIARFRSPAVAARRCSIAARPIRCSACGPAGARLDLVRDGRDRHRARLRRQRARLRARPSAPDSPSRGAARPQSAGARGIWRHRSVARAIETRRVLPLAASGAAPAPPPRTRDRDRRALEPWFSHISVSRASACGRFRTRSISTPSTRWRCRDDRPSQRASTASGSGDRVLLSVGRLEESKGFHVLLRALAALQRTRRARGTAVALGRRSATARIGRRWRRWPRRWAPSRVRFLGRVTDAEMHAWHEAVDSASCIRRSTRAARW